MQKHERMQQLGDFGEKVMHELQNLQDHLNFVGIFLIWCPHSGKMMVASGGGIWRRMCVYWGFLFH